MGLFSRKAIVVPEEYVTFNKFSADKEKLLCVGGATTECKHKVETKLSGCNKDLKLYYPKNQAAKIIKYWLPMFEIYDGHSAMSLISNWIEKNNYVNTVSDKTTLAVKKDINRAAQKFNFDATSLLQSADKVKIYGAFDLERLGYIVRVCFSVGFLTEDQAWNCLEQLWEDSTEHFENWDDYMVSFLNGQEELDTNWYSDTIVSYVELKQNQASLINRYKLT
ncbi:DUF1266 domain-containing protein [Listeria sp. ILCC797]|uniref:DUF1266 domain-containing protein n=1 Tax=Listeria sp. ILCC797 TaxID=1918333 RepID=UPI000B587760|nr:DUF1266 domain-containing protein [Listeria sp. ILCC797]